jgi:hypothetical protein
MKKSDPLRRCREAKARFAEELLAHPDVHGVGIGYKRTGRKKTRTLCLVVHVYKKLPLGELEASRAIPKKLSFFSEKEQAKISVPTDVCEIQPPEPEVKCGSCNTDFEDRVRPVPGGFSIGLVGVAGGTLGGWVWDRTDDQIVLLSNEHVLGSAGGEAVIQPSDFDGGSFPADHFANVVRAGTLDASIANAIDGDDSELEIECSGPAVYEIADATLEMVVEKVGQTTGLTCGIVELIDYDSKHYGSRSDLWIDGDGNDFSQGGDSGSLYVEQTHPDGREWKRIVGLHWGGSGNDGVGHPIRAVFNDLNLTTVCGGVIEALIEAIFSSESETAEAESEIRARALRYCPAPPFRRREGAQFHVGIARDFERRIKDSKVGSMVLEAIRAQRADVVNFLMDGDGWRATAAALAPLLAGKVTTDEVLDHRITADDIYNFKRVIRTAHRIRPKSKPLFQLAEKLLANAEGRTLNTIIFGDKRAKRKRPARPRR